MCRSGAGEPGHPRVPEIGVHLRGMSHAAVPGRFVRQLPPAQRNALNKDPKSLFVVEGRVSHACAPHC